MTSFSDDTSLDHETLLEFPCEFSVKAMGLNAPDFHEVVIEIVQKHCPTVNHECASTRSSKNGKWLSVTVTFEASSKKQLDAIYMELTAHERVTMSL